MYRIEIKMGDFNIDMLSSGNNNFKHLMAHKKLLNIVNELTNFSIVPGTYIDLVFTNNPNIVDKV